MGEIKSTMDIILEKAKGFTLTEEDRAAFQDKEVKRKVRGLVQKFLDGIVALRQLKEEVAALEKRRKGKALDALKEEALRHIKIEADNGPLYEILEEVLALDVECCRELHSKYRARLEKERRAIEDRLRERFQEKGITGSAVAPNAFSDPEWRLLVSEMEKAFRRELRTFSSSADTV